MLMHTKYNYYYLLGHVCPPCFSLITNCIHTKCISQILKHTKLQLPHNLSNPLNSIQILTHMFLFLLTQHESQKQVNIFNIIQNL